MEGGPEEGDRTRFPRTSLPDRSGHPTTLGPRAEVAPHPRVEWARHEHGRGAAGVRRGGEADPGGWALGGNATCCCEGASHTRAPGPLKNRILGQSITEGKVPLKARGRRVSLVCIADRRRHLLADGMCPAGTPPGMKTPRGGCGGDQSVARQPPWTGDRREADLPAVAARPRLADWPAPIQGYHRLSNPDAYPGRTHGSF